MIRETYGATAIIRVRVGRISATQLFHGRDPGGTVLMAGRTWGTVVANRMTNTRATTNSGSAARSSSRLELVWSKTFSRLSAAHAPIAIDSGIDSIAASATSTAEFTSLGPSKVLTGSWASSDVPRLPCSRPVTHPQYRVSTGWAGGSWLRRAPRRWGVPDGRWMARGGPRGSAWVARNTRTDTRIRTTIPSSSRRRMTPHPPPIRNLFTAATLQTLTEPG